MVKVEGHGRLLDPVGRSSAWRLGFNTPHNFNDNALYCGGFSVSEMFTVILENDAQNNPIVYAGVAHTANLHTNVQCVMGRH